MQTGRPDHLLRPFPGREVPLAVAARPGLPRPALGPGLPVRVRPAPQRAQPSGPLRRGRLLAHPADRARRVGPLDDRFFLYFEETDWCRRAWSAGLPILLCMDCEVVHLEGKAAELVSQFSLRQFQHSYRLYVAKHRGQGDRAGLSGSPVVGVRREGGAAGSGAWESAAQRGAGPALRVHRERAVTRSSGRLHRRSPRPHDRRI